MFFAGIFHDREDRKIKEVESASSPQGDAILSQRLEKEERVYNISTERI